jgi:hypothetical protein
MPALLIALALALAGLSAPARHANAACNVIPGTTQRFRAAQTTIDRPFATPGDFVTLGLDPKCDTAAFSSNPADQVVTLIFTPPQGGLATRNVVVLATDCGGIGSCPGVARVICIQANKAGLPIDIEVPDAQHLRFRSRDGWGGTGSSGARAEDQLSLRLFP